MKSVILPHVKNKSGNITDPDNYRAIAVSNAETKIVESVCFIRLVVLVSVININLASRRATQQLHK